MKDKVKVKLVNRGSKETQESFWRPQTPGNKGILGSCEFTFNPLDENYDWLVVIDDVPKLLKNWTEELKCPKENTIFVSTEPSSISYYGKAFVNQFKYLITNHKEDNLPHKNALRSHTGNVWMYGKDYDSLLKENTPHKKTKKISTICSNKQQGHTVHKMRFNFTKKMEDEIKELERFGRGFKWIDTKAEAIDDYEFHVTIENHIEDNVWTEKLADAFLGYSVPIYYGCPNVYDYFPKDSLIQIDISNMDKSIEEIKKIISNKDEYKRRLPAVIEARRRVIEEYNLLAMINKIVESSKRYEFTPNEKIYCRRKMRAKNISDLYKFLKFRINNHLKEYKK